MDLDDLRLHLPLRIMLAKKTASSVAVEAGLGVGAITDILSGKSQKPRYATLIQIAQVLGCSVDDLFKSPMADREDGEPFPAFGGPIDIKPGGTVELAHRLSPGARDLPVLGQAKAGYSGIFMGNGDPIAWIERPAKLAGIPSAFAVLVRGDSMEPRYFEGEVLHINPSAPVRTGHFVLIELNSGEAYVKRFRHRNDSLIRAEQFNPPVTIDYVTDTVRHIYRVIGTAEDM